MRLLVLFLAAILAAGCLGPGPVDEGVPEPGRPSELRVGDALLHAGGPAGGLALVHLAEGGAAEVTFPADVLMVDAEGRLVPGGEPVALTDGEIAQFLAPLGATSINVTVSSGGESREAEVVLAAASPIVSGERAIELMKVQRDQFAHRMPGHENYSKAIDYFATFFADLGYEVENFETPLPDVKLPGPRGLSTQSVESVLGYKRGTGMADRYIVVGGHFDVVEATTHGAFDNTAGTVAVLAMAEAFANLTTSRTIVFAAWGGEEDGILGSQAWVSAHPELVPFIDLYVNFDVTALAWPAPLVDPAPVVFASGPDGPMGDALAQHHQTIQTEWLLSDAEFVYESVAQGQATGAGVNAQSDHTPFAARGIPVVFQFTSRVPDVFSLIHSEKDTVENMTAYALFGVEGVGRELNESEVREGEAVLARSFETQTMGGFYLVVLTDNGVLSPARPAPPAALRTLENTRS